MADHLTLARPYAKAIFEIAALQQNFSRWSYVLSVLSWIVQDARVRHLLRNATLSMNTIAAFFDAVCESDFKPEELSLIHVLAYSHRLSIVSSVANLYEKLRAAAEKTLKVELISAIVLNDEQKKRFAEKLGDCFARTIQLDCRVDKALMGGYVVKADNRVIDASLRGELINLKKMMSGG